ncbi:hypothetical protein N9L68_01400 [bacterium]|nr:hypothetical protein [bacterium]
MYTCIYTYIYIYVDSEHICSSYITRHIGSSENWLNFTFCCDTRTMDPERDPRVLRQRLLESGGVHQQAEARQDPNADRSSLASRVLKLMGWGTLSPNQARWLCEGAELDGLTHPDIISIAHAGAEGDHPQNVRRDILRTFLIKDNIVPRPLPITVGMKDKEEEIVERDMQVVLPMHIADFTFEKNRHLFKAMWASGEANESFWNKMRPDDPTFQLMGDIMSQPNWRRRATPLILHGDAGRFTVKHEQKWLVFSVRSFVAETQVRPQVVPLFSIVDSARCKVQHGWAHDTLGSVWPILVQNFNDGGHENCPGRFPTANAGRRTRTTLNVRESRCVEGFSSSSCGSSQDT